MKFCHGVKMKIKFCPTYYQSVLFKAKDIMFPHQEKNGNILYIIKTGLKIKNANLFTERQN